MATIDEVRGTSHKVHPVLGGFPLMQGNEFQGLVESIRELGVLQPVILTYNKRVLVDGRNRLRACGELGIECPYVTLPDSLTDDQIIKVILGANLVRRHMENEDIEKFDIHWEM